MASIQDMYNKSEFAKLADKSKDKTPISAEDGGNKLHKDDKALATARGGKLNLAKYSDSVER
tara:strand:- start:616 stop:801 length:186 start_codon:yes stop_codon:yes gene_type:complete